MFVVELAAATPLGLTLESVVDQFEAAGEAVVERGVADEAPRSTTEVSSSTSS